MSAKPTYEELEKRVQELERALSEREAALDRPTGKSRDENPTSASAEQYRLMVEKANDAILVAQDGVFVFSNPRAEAFFGYSKRELGSRPLAEFVHEADRRMVEERHKGRLAGDTSIPDVYIFRIIQKSGGIRWVNLKVALFSWENRPATLCFMADITKRKRAEDALRRSDARFRLIFEQSTAGIAIALADGRFIDANQAICDMLGYTREELLRMTVLDVTLSDDRDLSIQTDQPVLAGKQDAYRLEKRYRHKEGRPIWADLSSSVIRDDNGNIRYAIGVVVDITDRKRAEKALRNALAEKEILLREIHHRVKNNMQTIVGLLRMHARRTDNAQLTEIFNDCRNRIGAMSLIHEALYLSDDLAKIDFEAYLKKLCRNLGQAHDAGRKGITLTVSASCVSLNMDQGIAVGMIIAELISNAFKHAFPHNSGGTVSVHLDRPEGETVRLVVSDTGKGLPPDFDIRNPPSLGMKLVAGAVTRELGGTIDVETGDGARFIIRFKNKDLRGFRNLGGLPLNR